MPFWLLLFFSTPCGCFRNFFNFILNKWINVANEKFTHSRFYLSKEWVINCPSGFSCFLAPYVAAVLAPYAAAIGNIFLYIHWKKKATKVAILIEWIIKNSVKEKYRNFCTCSLSLEIHTLKYWVFVQKNIAKKFWNVMKKMKVKYLCNFNYFSWSK